ncbi:MAG: D-lysine 5,6-aminomutase subunit alpha [Polyangiaceae bacterium]|nr:D-lysine 5,6-aminomutase subunit alpha [Polyangiaceae bacterium]
MATLPLDHEKIERCRALAASIADDVQGFIDAHTTVGVERTTLRAYGVTGVDPDGVPLVNTLTDRLAREGALAVGAATHLARALLAGAGSVQEAAEALAYGGAELTGELSRADVVGALDDATADALRRIDDARAAREGFRAGLRQPESPEKYVIVATGNIHDDATQAKAAAHAGADIIAVIRATAQSLLDFVPEGATTEGYGGTYATQENFRIIREATRAAATETGRYVQQTNYSSGLCMAEIAWMAAVEGLDMLLNDAMYGILFRDINMCRTFCDQYASRRIIARAGIVINTGEDNYLTTSDAVDKAYTVLASQFINDAFARRAGLADSQIGLGHAFEIDPWLEDGFLLELAQAQLVRQVFPRHPIKWMPPTKHKTGDVFQSHVHDAMFNLVGVMTGQSIALLGMFSEAIHTPLLMDRYLALKSAKYVFGTARHLGDELAFRPGGVVERRAQAVLDEALACLEDVAARGIWDAIGAGVFADVKRRRDGGKGFGGVVARAPDYANPLLDRL